MAACTKFLKQCWETTQSRAGHDHNVLSSLQVLSARPGYIKTMLPVEQRHLNNHKTVHGGVLLSLTDTVTSLALSTMGISPPTGASVNISCEFVRPAGREGDQLFSVGEVVKLGRTTAFTKVTFYDQADKVVAFGSHTKHMGTNKATKRFSEDGEHELPLEDLEGGKGKSGERAKL